MEEINDLIGKAKETKKRLDAAKKKYEAAIIADKDELAELETQIENMLLAKATNGVNSHVFANGCAGWSQTHVVIMPENITSLPINAFFLFAELLKEHPATFQLKVLPGAFAKLKAKEPDTFALLNEFGFGLDKTQKFYIS